MRSVRPLAFLAAAALHTGSILAQPNYVVSELPLPEWPNRIIAQDMDGDGRQDLIVPQWTQNAGRELLIHLQGPSGRFEQQVSRFVEIKPEIVAVATADLREEPGKELLLFSSSTVFSLSSSIPSYTGNLMPLFDWNLIASVPDRREILFFDIEERDGIISMLLPGRESYGLFRSRNRQGFEQLLEFTTVNTELDPSELPQGPELETSFQINASDGIVLDVTARSHSSFRNLVSEWERDGEEDTLLRSSHWLPAAVLAAMSSPDELDIMYLNIGQDLRGQINILGRNASAGFTPTPSWQGAIDTSGEIRLVDFNGDGLADILRTVNEGDEWTVYFHANLGGEFNLAAPDQIMRFNGYDLNLQLVDVDQDGQPELAASYYTIPVVNAIRNTSIVRTQLLYRHTGASAGAARFSSRPDMKLDESFSASSVRGLSQQIHLQTDLSGDGRKDALSLSSEGALIARRIGTDLRIADQAFWQYVPARTITSFEVLELNDDGIADLILYHSGSASILVSSP